MSAASDLIAELAACGITVEANGDKLRYAPPSKLTPDQLRRLTALKVDVLAHLTATAATTVQDTPRSSSARPRPVGPPIDPGEFARRLGRVPAPIADISAPVVAHPNANDRAVFAAWDRVIGFAPITAKGLLRRSASDPNLESALTAIAGTSPTRIDEYLASLSGVSVGEFQIVIARRGTETQWRLATAWSIAIAMRVAGTPSVERVEGFE